MKSILWQGIRGIQRQSKKEREGRRRRLKGDRGRGTLEKEKPPIFGMIQCSGEVVIRMLANVQQATIEPLLRATIALGTILYTDEYDIYARVTRWKASGHCFALGYVLSGASRRRNCRTILRSFSSFTTLAVEAKHCSIRSLSDFWHDLPGTPDEPWWEVFLQRRSSLAKRLRTIVLHLVKIDVDLDRKMGIF